MNRKRDLQLTSNEDDTGPSPMQVVEPQALRQITNLGMTARGRLGLDKVMQVPLAGYITAIRATRDGIIARCAADEGCHAAYPNLHQELQAIVDRLAKSHLLSHRRRPRNRCDVQEFAASYRRAVPS
jgi:hypothetical protein